MRNRHAVECKFRRAEARHRFRRHFRGLTVRRAVGLDASGGYVGAEDRNAIAAFHDPEHPQRVAIDTCPPGHVLVMDSRKDARAASAGAILIMRLMVRGGAGVVTDDGFRDSEGIGALDIPAFHARPSAPTSYRPEMRDAFDAWCKKMKQLNRHCSLAAEPAFSANFRLNGFVLLTHFDDHG